MYRVCWVVQVPVGMRGHAEDVKVAVADLEYEQDVEPAQRHRTVDVENVDGQHAGGLRAQELASWVSVLRDGAGGIRWWPAGPIRVGPVLAYELAPTSELTLLGEHSAPPSSSPRSGEKGDELVAAKASEQVPVADDRTEAGGDLGEDEVAGEVAVAVVDDLEVVEVDHEQADRRGVGSREQAGAVLLEMASVGQVGQRVGARLPPRRGQGPQLAEGQRGAEQGEEQTGGGEFGCGRREGGTASGRQDGEGDESRQRRRHDRRAPVQLDGVVAVGVTGRVAVTGRGREHSECR